jgi:hypothetical protein
MVYRFRYSQTCYSKWQHSAPALCFRTASAAATARAAATRSSAAEGAPAPHRRRPGGFKRRVRASAAEP